MRFRAKPSKAESATSPKMELLRRRSGPTQHFKRSRSVRASVKLISKIRSHHLQQLSSSPVSFDPRGSSPPTSSSTFGAKNHQVARGIRIGAISEEGCLLADDLKTRLSIAAALPRHQGDCASAYENPTFLDSSHDSSTASFFHEELEPKIVLEHKRVGRPLASEDPGLTVFVGNGTEGATTQVKKKVSSKGFFRSKPKPAAPSNGDAPQFKSDVDEIENRLFPTHKMVLARSQSKTEVTQCNGEATGSTHPLKKLHSLQGMEFLEGFSKKKQQHQQQQQQHRLNHQSSIHINPLTAQPSLNNIHLHALFGAIEQGYLDRARAILESTDVDINSVNSDGLTPLDAAVLSNNRPMVKMLLAFGAQEGNQFKTPEALGSHVASLLTEAERRVHDLAGGGLLSPGPSSNSGPSFLEPGSAATATSTGSSQAQRQEIGGSHRGSFSAQHNNLTGCGGGASAAEDKQLAMWERRARALRKMLLGFDQARPPDVPFLVTIDVIGTDSVLARFLESDSPESFFCTKFKIQWSVREDFSIICGERELLDMKQKECRIDGLLQGQKYYFRAASGNLKGYSRFRPTSPAYLTPSSWRDIDGKTARFEGRLEQLDGLLSDLRGSEFSQETPALQRRNHKKKTTIKQLFTATSKFQKNLRRGAFFACLLYHEDKVLVTNEDFLPVIEVDETYPSCVYNDLNWLMKVACTWDDVKSLRQDMEKSNSSSSNHFRIKLLQAATQMQAALCVQDLGQLYYKPIRDIQGTLVFCTVNCVKSPKQVSVLNSRWLPLAKVAKKFITHEDSSVSDILMASIQDQMSYHQLSSVKLSRGLYLGYLKMQSSVDSIQIVVPAKSPNVLPHCKIRDNPHVSSEEWDYLKRMGRQQQPGLEDDEKENISSDEQLHLQQNLGTEQQKLFVDQVAGAARRLFGHMDVSAEDSLSHRLYDAEVIELGSEVSLLVAVPSPESACSVPGTREILLQRPDLLSLPIQVFEMVHLATYHSELIKRYSRLSCVLELDTAQAQHSQREAFSTSELSVAKDRLARLQHLQSRMNSVWKGSRWLVDLVSFARDRGPSSQAQNWGICMRQLLSLERLKGGSSSTLAISICSGSSGNGLKRSLLQIPPRDPKLVKASPGRGSWPGPGVNNGNGSGNPTNLLGQELSKSEQQLPLGSYPRKGSNSSNCSSASEPYKSSKLPSSQPSSTKPLMPLALSSSAPRLPPSKSEDTLARPAVPPSKHQQQRKQHVVSSANTSPLLGPKVMSKSSVASNSESAHSVSSSGDESQPSRQPKLPRPTACVASIAAADRQGGGSGSSTSSGVAASNPVEMPENVVQVYAAYESGMASGTSLKVQLYERTTAREVIRLVVNHLNKTVKLRGLEGPFYAEEELQNFCLVVVIGARERCLRDDFKVLQLQNPWKKGQLCVRQKQEVLAALELSSKHTAYL